MKVEYLSKVVIVASLVATVSGCAIIPFPVIDPSGSRRHLEGNTERAEGGNVFRFKGKYGLSGTVTRSTEKPGTWIVRGRWKYQGSEYVQISTCVVDRNYRNTRGRFHKEFDEQLVSPSEYITLKYKVFKSSRKDPNMRKMYPNGFKEFEQEIEVPDDAEFFVTVIRRKS